MSKGSIVTIDALFTVLTIYYKDPLSSPSSVKPPIFDLLLAVLIALYLGLVYVFVQVSDTNIWDKLRVSGTLLFCSPVLHQGSLPVSPYAEL